MNKNEFIKKLRKRLEILEDKEIDDIVSEYTGYIEEKVNTGLTEEEAVKELGDFDEIVSDLLAAYKVKEPKNGGTISSITNKISLYIDKLMDDLSGKSFKDILKIIIEILLIILVIAIFKFPFNILEDLGANLFLEIGHIGEIFYSIWTFLIELCYFILAIFIFIKIIDNRYFKGINKNPVNKEIIKVDEKSSKKKEENKDFKRPKSFIDVLTSICMFFLKFIVFFILIGVIIYLVCVSFAFGISIYLLITGVKYFGIIILILALIFSGVLLLELSVNFMFNKKTTAKNVLISLIVIIVLTGLGLTLGASEIANTELIYASTYNEKTITKEVEMTDNLKLLGYDKVIIDESLDNTIKIEYTYPDIANLEIDIALANSNNNTYLDYKTNYLSISKLTFDNFIKSLKEKRIYVYDYDIRITKIIYINSKNYQKLLEQTNNLEDGNYIYSSVFKVTDITEISDDYVNLTLYPFDNPDNIATVKVLKSLANNIIKNEDYNFSFNCNVDFNDNDTENIFKICSLIDINYAE